MNDIFKVINAGRKNLATTLFGLLAGMSLYLVNVQNNPEHDWSDWKAWLPSAFIFAMGFVAKNAHFTGSDGGAVKAIGLLLIASFSLSSISCTSLESTFGDATASIRDKYDVTVAVVPAVTLDGKPGLAGPFIVTRKQDPALITLSKALTSPEK